MIVNFLRIIKIKVYLETTEKVELNTKLNAKILEGSPQGTPLVYNYTNKIHNLRKNNILNNASRFSLSS